MVNMHMKRCSTSLTIQFSSVQSLSRVRLFVTPWIAARQASLSITNSQSSPKPTSIESVMPSSHLILCRPLFLLPSIPLSITVFSSESTLPMRWPKYWSFSFSIIPSKEHPGLISFRIIREIKLKNTMRYHLTLARMVIFKKSTKSAGEDVERREPSYTVGGNVNWYSYYREQYGGPWIPKIIAVQLFGTPRTVVYQSMKFSRQEYWRG